VSDQGVLVAAYLFDWIAGDPEWLPHPVRLIGKCIEQGEEHLRKRGQSPTAELMAGAVLTFGMVTTFYLGTAKAINWAHKRNKWFGIATEVALAWTCLAARNLHDEASTVAAALEMGNIPLARLKLARIVGRDTQQLDIPEIGRAIIETVAESASDGVIAPLFYMSIGGVPLAMAYKTINTLDSMIGHSDAKYFYFGKMAARLDDVANFVPARLTALSIAAAAVIVEGASPASAVNTWWLDGDKHKSPNAGQPESAMAGALQVRLGGANLYDGVIVSAPLIGENFLPPLVPQTKQAIRIAAIASALGLVMALILKERKR
jgi:adenosylcobinamide-phosphate synthase